VGRHAIQNLGEELQQARAHLATANQHIKTSDDQHKNSETLNLEQMRRRMQEHVESERCLMLAESERREAALREELQVCTAIVGR
jgi:hypothetical protein